MTAEVQTLNIEAQLGALNQRIDDYDFGQEPNELYEPIRYILSLGGKRLRPLLALLSYSIYKDTIEEALEPSIAIEVFHNFTLMHDDIMDEAPLRRGQVTVHEKWNSNIAILSGDAMLIKSYDLMLSSPASALKKVLARFNQTALEVCEGQQYDMNFESRDEVSEEEYINMIRLKTAVLLGFALELGALVAGASESDTKALYDFGVAAGIGFQLKDDLLDVYGEQQKVGKQVGGDIISNKKTFLLISALNLATPVQRKELDYWLGLKEFDKAEKVAAVTRIYDEIGVKALTEKLMGEYFDSGFHHLDNLGGRANQKAALVEFSKSLIARER